MRFDPLIYQDEFCEIRKLPSGMIDLKVKLPEDAAEGFWDIKGEMSLAEGYFLNDEEGLESVMARSNP
jgi:hypothetical protein